MPRKKLHWHEIGLGDILKDYRPSRQEWVHYLVVDKRAGEQYVIRVGVINTPYYVLQPLDCNDATDIYLNPYDVHHEYATWKKVA